MLLLSRFLLLSLSPLLAHTQDIQPVWEKKYGGDKQDRITKVIEQSDGELKAIGITYSETKGDADGWLLTLDPTTGNLKQQLKFGGLKADLFHDLCQTFDGGLLIAGQTQSKEGLGADDAWLIKMDYWGKTLWDKNFGTTGGDAFKTVDILNDGSCILAGYRNDKKEADLWLLSISEMGNVQWEKSIGHNEFADLQGMLITTDNHILLYGSTVKKSREGNSWVMELNPQGELVWKKNLGSKTQADLLAMEQASNGDFALTGQTFSDSGDDTDAWFARLDEMGSPKINTTFGGSNEDEGKAIIAMATGQIVVAGQSQSRAASVRYPQGFIALMADGGEPTKTQYYGQGKENVFESIITLTDGSLVAAGYQAISSFNNTDGWLLKIAGNVPSPKDPVNVSCTVVKFPDTNGDGYLSPNENDFLTFELKNLGKEDLFNISIVASLKTPHRGLKLQANPTKLAALPAGSTKTVTINVSADETLSTAFAQVSVTLSVGANEVKKIETQFLCKRPEKVLVDANAPVLNWDYPNPIKTDIRNIRSANGKYTITVRANSAKPLSQQDFKVYHNGKILDDAKDANPQLNHTVIDESYIYSFDATINLEEGENRIYIEVITPDGRPALTPINVYYQSAKPNLHVLAIGPTYEDLKFPSKDATDFAQALAGQAGVLYGDVTLNVLNTKALTATTSIRNSIEKLLNGYVNTSSTRKITDRDVIVLFVSSHGRNNKGQFKLVPSDLDPEAERTTTVDYQTDVLAFLDQIPCKKLIFLDACHSGAAKGSKNDPQEKNISTALYELNQSVNGATVIASCRPEELSYEDPVWENGAFTEALLEALSDKAITDQRGTFSADANRNGLISIQELFSFLERRVPGLVSPVKGSEQHPFLQNKGLDQNLEIFVVKK